MWTTATNEDRIDQFLYLAIFAGLTISLFSKTIENSQTAQIAKSISTGWTGWNGQTSFNFSRGQNE